MSKAKASRTMAAMELSGDAGVTTSWGRDDDDDGAGRLFDVEGYRTAWRGPGTASCCFGTAIRTIRGAGVA